MLRALPLCYSICFVLLSLLMNSRDSQRHCKARLNHGFLINLSAAFYLSVFISQHTQVGLNCWLLSATSFGIIL